ncbi:hypothetical protein ACFXPN_29270 [Streptomyces griseorubiginosus]|uniref:hypothetical protein n=1 Tax=Streptomyces griseorubiginosus TaxID=67304 RepID=UPI0036B13DD3
MSYELNAVIGRFDLLRSRTAAMGAEVVAPLRQGMGLVPVTMMSPSFEQALRVWSQGGPVACVEADFHGGDGYQTAAVWHMGAVVWGPVHAKDFTGPRESWPINGALAQLDVVMSASEQAEGHDLFRVLGLGWEQDLEGWQSAARRARWAATYDDWYQEQLAERERAARAAAESEKYRRLPDVPVALDGKAIMELLDLPPGPLIGAATRHLQELHLERGPLSRDEAVTRLRAWAVGQDMGHSGG